MSINPWFYAYAAALLVLGLLDGLWLGWVARDFYRREVGDLMAAEVAKTPALVFYFAYPAGLLALSLNPLPASATAAMARAALVGLVVYGVYDLSNMATLRHWSLKLALVDVAWGVLVSAAAGTAAWFVLQRQA